MARRDESHAHTSAVIMFLTMRKALWVACVATAAGAPGEAGKDSTATFRGDVRHTGVYDSAAPSLRSGKWKFKSNGRIFSSPAVYNGTVLVGSNDHHLYAVNATDGTLQWKFDTKGAVASSPAVANGVAFIVSLSGSLYAVDAATGTQKWKFDTAGEHRFTAPGVHGLQPSTETMPDPFDVFLSSPTVEGGAVFFGSGDGNVYAVDAATGVLRWKFPTGDVVHSSPAVDSGRVYVGSWDSYLYALDASTGKAVWRFKTGEDPKIHNQVGIQSSPVVSDGIVYFGCRDSNLYAVDATTGTEKWKFNNKGSWVITSPAVSGGRVYFATSDSSRFHALDAKTGAPVFQLGTGLFVFSSPAIAGGKAYFGTHAGVVKAVDLKSQAIAAEFRTDASKENLPKYSNPDGRLNQRALYPDSTLDGIIVGLDRLYSVGSVFSSPVIRGGVLYVGSTDGYLYALE
jgi:outer membrane protein assembly factor BamB